MGPSSLTHPDDEILRAYGLAQLDDRASGSVNRHLRSCDSCRCRMATLGASGFPDRARDAQPGTTAPIELKRESGSNSPEPNWTWPAELNALPDHEIIRRLDKGGMGAVYLARHKILKRLEALKVVQQHLTDRPQYVARFHREIEAAGRLDHPNVVPAYGAMKTASGLVFVMK
jgi:serine/threonine protein kinase